MNRLLLTTSLFWLTAIPFFSYAQNENKTSYRERVDVHLNTDFLVTGETLYLSIHCLEADKSTYSTLSELAYVELIGENEKPVLQIKVPLTEGCGAGDFFLPSTLPSGNYTLIAYTKWMRNFPSEDFFNRQVTIINPYLKPLTSGTQSNVTRPYSSSPNQESKKVTKQVQLDTDKKKYAPRQRVIVTIKNNDPLHACKIALNVHQYDADSSKSGSTKNHTAIKESTGLANKITFLPDLRGETIGGVVKETSSGKPLSNSAIYLSATGSSYIFQLTQTDTAGRFFFSTKNIFSPTGIQFQVDQQAMPVTIIVDNEFTDEYKIFKPRPLSIDTSMRKRIEQRNLYSQVENAYFITKHDSILNMSQEPFFGKPDKVYRLDDYTRFPTMEDIFREYMYEVFVSKRDGKFLLRLVNSTTKNGARFLNTPLLLMDGLPIFDTEILMNYNPLLINTVSLITRPYVFGGILYDGILAVNTKTGSAQELMIKPIRKDYTPWQHAKKYYSPTYSAPERLARTPDYRIQLFWSPIISIAPGQEFSAEFYTSDVEGVFLMEAKGFNTNGESIDIRKHIDVRK